MMNIVEILGFFQKKIYQNGDFTVAIFRDATTNRAWRVAGDGIPIAKNVKYRLVGELTTYQKTGEETIRLIEHEIPALDEENAFVEYLATPPIRLSRLQAKKIYKLFPKKAVDILDNNPEQIYHVIFKNLKNGDERYRGFIKQWQRQRKLVKITSFLAQYGISRNHVMKLQLSSFIDQYDDLGAAIKDNPYYMMHIPDVHIDFHTCDEIAKKLKYPSNSPERIKAYMKYVLCTAMQSGHMFLYCYGKEGLIAQVMKALAVSGQEVAAILNERPEGFVLEQDKKAKNYRVYLYDAHEWEVGLAKEVYTYIKEKTTKIMNKTEVKKFLVNYEKKNKITLAQKQQEAVYAVAKNPITIITGGAGTGKTTSLNAVLTMLEASGNDDHCLLASTGKASQRMTEATGRQATTIHHCIACDEDAGRHAKNITCDALIVDEFSMTDCKIAYLLFSAIQSCKRIVIVGDVEQLPSVGAGNVLKDFIDSGKIPVVALDVIQRQALDSPIVSNAQKVLQGDTDFLFHENFRFIEMQNADAACSAEPSRQKGCFKSFLCGIKTRMTQAQNEAQARAIQREERRIQEAIELSDLDETLEEMPEDFSDKLRYWWRNHAGFRIGISAIAVLLVILLMVSAFHTREKVNTQYDLGAVGAENGMLKSEEEKETQKQGEETEKQGEETKIHEIVTSQLMDFRKTLDGNLAPVDVKADSLEPLPNMAEIVETVQRSTGQTTETYPGSHTTKQPAGSIATISIPSINLKNAPVMGSVALSDLAKGTGHFENTPLLDGNVGIAGHNNTHFKYLANVAMGAKIQYNINGVTRTYEVTDMRAISDRDWGVFTDYGDNRLTLITCEHAVPNRRIAVTAIQVGADQTISNHTTNTQNHSKPRPAVPNTGYYHEDSGAYHDEGYTDFVGTFTGEN